MEETAIHMARVTGWKYAGKWVRVRVDDDTALVEEKDFTAVVRICERLHLRLPDHEAHLLFISRGIGANPGRQWFGHNGRKEDLHIFMLLDLIRTYRFSSTRTCVDVAPR